MPCKRVLISPQYTQQSETHSKEPLVWREKYVLIPFFFFFALPPVDGLKKYNKFKFTGSLDSLVLALTFLPSDQLMEIKLSSRTH